MLDSGYLRYILEGGQCWRVEKNKSISLQRQARGRCQISGRGLSQLCQKVQTRAMLLIFLQFNLPPNPLLFMRITQVSFRWDEISIVNIWDSFAFLLFQYSCFVQICQIWTSLSLSPCQSEYWMKALGWKKKSCPDWFWFWIIKKYGKSIAGPLGKMVKNGCPGSSRKWVKYHFTDFSPYRGGRCGYLLTAPDVFRRKKRNLRKKNTIQV